MKIFIGKQKRKLAGISSIICLGLAAPASAAALINVDIVFTNIGMALASS